MAQPIFRNLKVVGTFYRTAEKPKLLTLVGQVDPVPCAFKLETDNPHDPWAVAVYLKVPPHAVEGEGEWVHAGYIPATVSGLVGLWIDGGTGPLKACADVTLEKGAPSVTLSVELAHE